MSEFKYKAIGRKGEVKRGLISASTKEDAIRQLKLKQLKIVKLNHSFSITSFKSVSVKDKTSYTRQFSTLIGASLPIDEVLAILAEQTENSRLKATTEDILRLVKTGVTLGDSLQNHTKIFDRLYRGIVQAGESAGVLDQVLLRLADHYERMDKLNRKVKASLAYPIVVGGIALLVVSALIIFVVPTFKEMFLDMGKELPLPTRIVLRVSEIARHWLPIAALATIIIVVLGQRWGRHEKGRAFFDRLKSKMPIIGVMLLKSSVARFSRTLSTLLHSGIPLLDGLRISRASLNNILLERVIDRAINSVEHGEPFAKQLLEDGQFPLLAVRMTAVGERTGNLSNMLSRVADYYESEVESAVDSVMAVIEPILILALGVVIGLILISMYLPLFEMATEAR